MLSALVFTALLNAQHVCTNTYTVPSGASTTGLCSVPAGAPGRPNGRPDILPAVVSGNRFVAATVYDVVELENISGQPTGFWQVRISLYNFGPFDVFGACSSELWCDDAIRSTGFERDW